MRLAAIALLMSCACEKPAPRRASPPAHVVLKPTIKDPCSLVHHLLGKKEVVCSVGLIDDSIAEMLGARADREEATQLFTTTDPKQLASVNKVPWARSVLIHPEGRDASVADLRELAPLTHLKKLYVRGAVRELEDACSSRSSSSFTRSRTVRSISQEQLR